MIGSSAQLSNHSQLAYTDPLTGLANRLSLDKSLSTMIESANGGPWCLMVLDLDDLHELNELLGHDAGDAAIRRLAGAMRAALRARPDRRRRGAAGGDDFAIIVERGRGGPFAVAGDIGAMGATGDVAVHRLVWHRVHERCRQELPPTPPTADGALHSAKAEGAAASRSRARRAKRRDVRAGQRARAVPRVSRPRLNGMGALLESVLADFDGRCRASVLERVARLAEACALSRARVTGP